MGFNVKTRKYVLLSALVFATLVTIYFLIYPSITSAVASKSPAELYIDYGRWGPYSVSAGTSRYFRIYFHFTFPVTPTVTWSNEVYPFSARGHYAIDRGYITTTYFDARVYAVDGLTDNYVNFQAIVAVSSPSSEPYLNNSERVKEKGIWYGYVYKGPLDLEKTEKAREAVIPVLHGLGWDGGVGVERLLCIDGEGNTHVEGDFITICLPFRLSENALKVIGEELAAFNFKLIKSEEIS